MAYLGPVNPPKQPTEKFLVEIDFVNELDVAGGETITGATVTSKNLATGADSTGTFFDAAAVTAGTKIRRHVSGGAHGERHRVQMHITTNAGNEYEHELDVPVEEV